MELSLLACQDREFLIRGIVVYPSVFGSSPLKSVFDNINPISFIFMNMWFGRGKLCINLLFAPWQFDFFSQSVAGYFDASNQAVSTSIWWWKSGRSACTCSHPSTFSFTFMYKTEDMFEIGLIFILVLSFLPAADKSLWLPSFSCLPSCLMHDLFSKLWFEDSSPLLFSPSSYCPPSPARHFSSCLHL